MANRLISHSERMREARRAGTDRVRGSAHRRGYTAEWREAAKRFLVANPACARCGCGLDWRADAPPERQGVVDHITPHRGDKRLFWDRSNWQSLCKRCHDRKTAIEDKGFGRMRK